MVEGLGGRSVGEHTEEVLRKTVLRLVILTSLIFLGLLVLLGIVRGQGLKYLVFYISGLAIFLVAHTQKETRPQLAAGIVTACIGSLAWMSFWVSAAEELAPAMLSLAQVLIISSFCWSSRATGLISLSSSVVLGAALFSKPELSSSFAGLLWLKVSMGLLICTLLLNIARSTIFRTIDEAQAQQARFALLLAESRSLESLGRLAGGVAHDFNNLLTVILGTAELLKTNPDLSEDFRQEISQIEGAGQRAAELTRQLLAVGRRQILRPRVLCPNSILDGISPLMERLVPANIEIEFIADENLGNVSADVSRLEQVIVNLIVNARDAMPLGGKIIVETSNATLDEQYIESRPGVRAGPYVQLSVTDTGEGMEPETRSRIFEPFYSTKDKSKGTGLGLATVHGIVTQSGGYIHVYSEPEHGTCFKIYMPRVFDELKQTAPLENVARQVLEPLQILLVEDQLDVQLTVARMLEASGHHVTKFSGAVAALKFYANVPQGSIQVLVTDVMMPQMSGPELAEQLLNKDPLLRVLYITGYTENTIVDKGVIHQGVHCLSKPFSQRLLDDELSQLVRAK